MREHHIEIATDEGQMGTYIAHPEGGMSLPVVLFLMDAPGKRELLHSMARTIASHGYYVMLPNLYYRSTPAFELDFASKESFEQMRELMMAMSNKMVSRDAKSLLAYAKEQSAADENTVGVVGYCMSGPFAIYVAAELPKVVKAAASFYGVRLHVDKADSPHLRLNEILAEIYVACAEHDDYVPMSMVDQFEADMQEANVRGNLERYWGNHHGFAFNDRPEYNEKADKRHWMRLLDLFQRNLH